MHYHALVALDAIDHVLIDELQHNGRITNLELAERIGLSPSACLRRVRSLEESGVIVGYRALIDRAVQGRSTSVFVEITLTSQEESVLDAFEAAVAVHPSVMSCHLMAGDADYLVHVACEDVSHYEQLHRTHLAQLPGVARIRSSFALRTVVER